MATVTVLPYEQETEPFRSLFPHWLWLDGECVATTLLQWQP